MIDECYDSLDSLLVSIEIQIKNVKKGHADIATEFLDESKIEHIQRILQKIRKVRQLTVSFCSK